MARTTTLEISRAGGRPTLREAEVRMDRLLATARGHFLASGYRETSVDVISRDAGISKRTIYHHFGSKAGLFTAIIETMRRTWISELNDIVLRSNRPEQVLEAVALHLLDVGTKPEMVELHRVFLVESHRFPILSHGNYDTSGIPVGMQPLLTFLQDAVTERILVVDDVALATEQFMSLVLAGIRGRLLTGVAKRPGKAERARIARQAVNIFLTGCRPVGAGSSETARTAGTRAEHTTG